MPQEPCLQRGMLVLLRKQRGVLPRRVSGRGPSPVPFEVDPKIPRRFGVMQALHRDRLQQKRIMPRCRLPMQGWRHRGHHSGFVHQRKIQITAQLGLFKPKHALFPLKFPTTCRHKATSFPYCIGIFRKFSATQTIIVIKTNSRTNTRNRFR
ncbi:hypothetical protein D3C74_367860 [compost metagenome]